MKSKTNKTAEVKKPTTVAAETKTTETKMQTVQLNSECESVLKIIVKNDGIGASEIRKKLKWGYVPSRALGQLKDNGFATMEDDKGYHVTAAGRKALEK